jgi:hypothetical protein
VKRLLWSMALVLVCAHAADAQYCWRSTGTSADARYCNAVAQVAEMVQPSAGMALAGGNPVPGASSTLGMRLGSMPRITVAGRVTGVFMNLADIERSTSTGDNKSLAHSLNLDAAVGVLSGWSLAPTIGGFGSLDVVASVGKLSLPDEFTQSPASWALGARVGILRESFTAPGVSITGMYRRFGEIQYGSRDTIRSDAMFVLRDNSVMSVRAVAGKRLFVLGANVGVGYDRFASKLESHRTDVAEIAALLEEVELTPSRITAFANVGWTMLILNAVAEGGYQRGGDSFTLPLPSGQSSRSDKSAYYGSLAIRLAL